jgi:HD-GYP domain-containing protein (c-di-GMP phosphodiesterase class II)
MRFGTIRRDLHKFLGQDSYRVIIRDPRRNAALMGLMEQVRLVPPVLAALAYFKRSDGYTYRHILRVFALSVFLALVLESRRKELASEVAAGPMHDYGKICVPLPVLGKTTPLRRSERAMLEHHAVAGYVLLCHDLLDPRKPAARVALEHHERKDGSGYPRGIRLNHRMVEIVVACDVYDALISPRPYRKDSYDNRTALEEITEMANQGKLDMEIVKALVSTNRKERPDPHQCKVSFEKRGRPPADNNYGILLEDDIPTDSLPV